MTGAADDDWAAAWQPVIDQIGTDLSDGKIHYSPDRTDAAQIRHFLEALEFDCPLHYDPEVARAHGFADVTAPYTAFATLSMRPVWRPGEALFTSAQRNAQPARISGKPRFPEGTPPVTGYFATETDTEFVRPVVAGERLGRRGNRLVSCIPKQTRIGRGAFLTFESETVDEDGQAVARVRSGMFLYNPHPQDPS